MAVAFVNNVGTGVNTVSATTCTLVPVQNCGAGNLVVIAGAAGGGVVVTGVTDTKGNTWVVDKTQGTTGGSCSVASTLQNGGALTTADTITVTFAIAGTNKVLCAMEFSGVRAGTRLDQTVGATGTVATAVSSGATAATTFADEVVIGAMAWAGGSGLTMTKGASYTALLEKDEGSGAFLGITLEYKIVAATAAMTADGTLSAAPTSWNAICATYMGLAAAGTPRMLASTGVGN